MKSTPICVDANIIVRLVAPDPDRDIQPMWQQWRVSGAEIIAPTLLRFEVVNAIHRRQVAGQISRSLAEDLVSTALDMPITYINEPWLHLDALRLAGSLGLPASYDAHYVALAQHFGATLWTADKRLYNAVHAHLDFVRLVDLV